MASIVYKNPILVCIILSKITRRTATMIFQVFQHVRQ